MADIITKAICYALIFGFICAIIIQAKRRTEPRKLTDYEKQLIRETAKKRREQMQAMDPKEDLICPNCGATLRAAYAECDYCGARTRTKDNKIPE